MAGLLFPLLSSSSLIFYPPPPPLPKHSSRRSSKKGKYPPTYQNTKNQPSLLCSPPSLFISHQESFSLRAPTNAFRDRNCQLYKSSHIRSSRVFPL
ncbi:unnamed protein product [Tuber melanosporum]|uniref:(Perigord truffle) hypothetical protein n=1 Tax=Tuber melanosporum (strain Mel28) TaxID=656061 RepID=D5GCX2_TUBMM|nr:uncharacterized protein GSTUM_00000849001 [Tuber melanosporum]CAZ82365.1 unnamed protein product [Tuber melanosporum]